MSEKSALVVDDTLANRDFLERLLMAAGFTVYPVSTAKAALDQVKDRETLTLALVDMQLPDMNGLQLTTLLRKQFPDLYLVVATMHDEVSLMESVSEKGGNVFLVKPHGFMELFKRLTTTDMKTLREGDFMVIDQYGPRPLKVAVKL
ncbi:MAG TPA: response regulator [Phototrophicaceae bacterium]|nr:response regulator [Phototrophicaceae bacterium]